jgi:hypothetical protein
MTHVAECPPSKHEALSSIPSTIKKRIISNLSENHTSTKGVFKVLRRKRKENKTKITNLEFCIRKLSF